MNMKFRKAGLSLLLGLLIAGTTFAQSGTLYVYLITQAAPQEYPLDQISKLTFTETDAVGHPIDGTTPQNIPFVALRYFTLKKSQSYPTGLASAATQTDVNVYPSPAVTDITVTSANTIAGVELYNLQGQKLLKQTPQATQATISLANLPAGIYLLQIAGETGITIKKIIKK
jgi:hypothetical protein